MSEHSEKVPCDGRQWTKPEERNDCLFPDPPIGRWHAVYTAQFAKEYNLPEENISTDLSPGVDYMEMDVQPYNEGRGTACLVNMLIKKPHDVAFFNKGDFHFSWSKKLHEQRKLAHLIDLEKYKSELKDMTSFIFSSRDYNQSKGFRVSTFSFFVENVLNDYDYITANANCKSLAIEKKYFPGGYSFWVAKASVWGRYKTPYESYDHPQRPKEKDFYNSYFNIQIPGELLSNIFKDVPIGGR